MNNDTLKMAILVGSNVIPVLIAIAGAYINLKIQIGVLQKDVDNLALIIGTKRALSEQKGDTK